MSKKITCVGTIQSNRSGILAEIKSTEDREDLSTKVFWRKDSEIVLSSYFIRT